MEYQMSNEIEERELIVKINHASYSMKAGTVDILFVSSDNGKHIELPSSEEFPTKGVFISSEFENISRQFKEEELFYLQKWTRDDGKIDELNSGVLPPGDHIHWAKGTAVKKKDPLSFIPIFDGKLPNISTGEVDINGLPVNKPFFIRDHQEIYGPFTANARQADETIKASPFPQTVLNIKNNFILKISETLLERDSIIATTPIQQYIKSLRMLPDISAEDRDVEVFDFISDEKLVAFFSKLKFGKKTILSKKETEKLKMGVSGAIKKGDLNKEDNRVIRIKEVLDTYLTEVDFGNDLINEYFTTSIGKSFLETYLKENNGSDIRHVSESKETKQVIDAQEEKLRQLKSQVLSQQERVEKAKIDASKKVEEAKKQAITEIDDIQKKSKEELEKASKEASSELQSDIIELESERDNITKTIKDYYQEHEKIKNLEDVKDEKKYLKRQSEEFQKAVDTQKDLLNRPGELSGKMAEVKIVLDMLQGHSLDKREENYPFRAPNIATIMPDQADQYIQTLVESFDAEDHSITFDEVANLLINIQQSFLTVLSGLPGTGKTSSIMRLSAAQHLSSNSGCFLNVPVARGWVSSRDFVGFNNSLKGVFQPAKTGIYQFLRQGQQKDSGSDKFLRMILLDEANLSPIEHYWSEFLAMSDKEGRDRPLDTGISGDERYLPVAKNIRFIATINNDNTTEPLSPRLCDRVPVISMGSPYIESSSEQIASLSLDGAIGYDLLEQWFGISDNSDFSTPSLIETFCEKMQEKEVGLGAEIHISPRKKNAMTAYCEKAEKYINPTLAIDFALSQHALPLINGHGQDFRKRLEGLESWAKSNNLVRTANLLQDILKAGEMYVDSYSFF